MRYFLSCDWGTSAFRLRLIELPAGKILNSIESTDGCAAVYQQWLEDGKAHGGRQAFYLGVLARLLAELEQKCQMNLQGLPVVVSGMASSSAGLIELPYKILPFASDGSDLTVHQIPPSAALNNSILLISGVRTDNDVMRGEESKLIGLLDDKKYQNTTLLLPGTHPKHIYIRAGKVSGFKTYMTGEFFSLLSKNSLLAMSVSENPELDEGSFSAGLQEGITGNILHSSFLIRIHDLFDRYTSAQNYHFLSGLLIGSELRDLIETSHPITLLENNSAGSLYNKALHLLSIPIQAVVDADEALIRGQMLLMDRHS